MKRMNILTGLIMIFTSFFIFYSCAPDYQTDFEVKTLVVPDKSQTPIVFTTDGGEKIAEVETNVALSAWSASSNAAWLTVEKQEGKVIISAGKNDTYAPRIGQVTIQYGYQAYYINVTQKGKDAYLLIDGVTEGVVKSVLAKDTIISVQVKSNMLIDHILIPDTVSFITVDTIVAVEGYEDEKLVSFKVDQNIGRKARYGKITFQSSDNYGQMASFLVIQSEMLFEEIPLRKEMLSTNSQQPTEGPIANLVDGNRDTYFHSIYSTAISEMHHFQIALDAPIEGCIFWYQNRNITNGKPTDVSIMVSDNGTDWRELVRITSGLPTGAASVYESAYYSSDTPFSYFRFVVNATKDGAGPRFFNMAEFKLYQIKK